MLTITVELDDEPVLPIPGILIAGLQGRSIAHIPWMANHTAALLRGNLRRPVRRPVINDQNILARQGLPNEINGLCQAALFIECWDKDQNRLHCSAPASGNTSIFPGAG